MATVYLTVVRRSEPTKNEVNMSKDETTVRTGGGIGFFGLLTIVFITLKLCHVIDWSWWWVLSPVWITVAIAFVASIALIVLTVCGESKKRRKS